MDTYKTLLRCVALSLLICLLLPAAARPQTRGNEPTQEQDEVVRITSELVQTDVMVFDKQGRFVTDLQPLQFELRVDGKVQPISFFEMIRAGSVNEEMQLAAARGHVRAAAAKDAPRVTPLDRGRTIIFFVDDLHLSTGSMPQVRQAILDFIDKQIGQNDVAAVMTASGQVGFLQQLTGEKSVLRAAVGRLSYREQKVTDMERPPMSEFHALQIERRDMMVTDYFIDEWLRQQPTNMGITRDTALAIVRARASQILRQAGYVTQSTLNSLQNIVRALAPVPGRKLLFFISDGFLLNERSSNVITQLRGVTDAAARSGTVIYSMDARGLSASLPEAEDEAAFDPSGRLLRASQGELAASQDGLHALARDTGGRPILNTNSLIQAVRDAVKETEVYYLLAWSPGPEAAGRGGKFRRIEVRIPSRGDLTVRVRRGFTQPPDRAASRGNGDAGPQPSPSSEILAALKSPIPREDVPTALYAGYTDTSAAGLQLTTLVQIESEELDYGADAERPMAALDLIGVVLDANGKTVSSFQKQFGGLSPMNAGRGRHINYSHQHRLPPGLYQVRVAARDGRNGRTGSAMQWIEIPDLKRGQLSLSSIFLSARPDAGAAPADSNPDFIFSVGRRFARDTRVQFISYIYNAARKAGAPLDVAIQIQVRRDEQPVVTTPLSKIDVTDQNDLTRLSYAAEIDLTGLPAGQYLLQLIVIDRAAKTSASQQVNFAIE